MKGSNLGHRYLALPNVNESPGWTRFIMSDDNLRMVLKGCIMSGFDTDIDAQKTRILALETRNSSSFGG